MSSRDRPKASAIFDKTEFVFSRKASFSEAFPTIADVSIVVTRGGHDGVREWNRVQRFGGNVGEYIDCSNPLCYRGGFSVGDLLRRMVASEQEQLSVGGIACNGYEGSPGGRRRYRSCDNTFSVSIDIKYKSPASDLDVSATGE